MEIRLLDTTKDNKLMFDIVKYEDDIDVFGTASIGRYNISPISKYGKTFVMLDKKNIVGVAEVMSSFDREVAYIYGLSINNNYRNKGLAHKLLSYVIIQLEKIGITTIQLTVDTDNIFAQKLYKKNGFVEKEILPNEYGDNIKRYLYERKSKVSHYFTKNANIKSNRKSINYSIADTSFEFITDNGVFSKQKVDYGTDLLLNTVYRKIYNMKVLDYGCGYGVVGVVLKKLCLDVNVSSIDINDRAVELTKLNYEKNNITEYTVQNVDEFDFDSSFDAILLNPPIRTGKDNVFSMYEKAYNMLNDGGSLYIVIQTKQGAKSSEKRLKEIFSAVKTLEISDGYRIIEASKR